MGFFTSIGDAFPGKTARFAAIAGLAFYLASAVWSALFIVALPQDPDWCKDLSEFEGCVEFKNTFEKLKYDHNREMADRNSYRVYALMLAGAVTGWLFLHWLPRRRGILGNPNQAVGSAVAYAFFGVIVVLWVPLLLSWLLPAPAKWFPRQFVEYADARVERELILLRRIAYEMDADAQR